jgi:hypothetical protein
MYLHLYHLNNQSYNIIILNNKFITSHHNFQLHLHLSWDNSQTTRTLDNQRNRWDFLLNFDMSCRTLIFRYSLTLISSKTEWEIMHNENANVCILNHRISLNFGLKNTLSFTIFSINIF